MISDGHRSERIIGYRHGRPRCCGTASMAKIDFKTRMPPYQQLGQIIVDRTEAG